MLFSNCAFAQQPSISAFTPTSGPAGTSVVITGSNFSAIAANNIVFFGATRATVSAATSTSLTVSVPFGATYQPITITVNGLTAYSATPFVLTFPAGKPIYVTSFAPKIDSLTDLHPNGLAIADYDGDGKPDIATANNYSITGLPASVSILRNTGVAGTISFASRFDLTTGVLTYAIAEGDLDGDGKPDLISSSVVDKTISIFKNTSTVGNITFAPKIDYATGSDPFSIGVNDFDGDGKPDIAVVNYLSNTLSIYKNTSAGGNISFAPKVDIATAFGPKCLAVGDLDGDGKPDLAIANELSNNMSTFRNTSTPGNISFAAKNDFATSNAPIGIAIGDLNNDGKADIAVSNSAIVTFSVFKNNSTSGAISLSPKLDFFSNGDGYLIAISDLNGDGKPDIILPGSNMYVSQNVSSGSTISFNAAVTFNLSYQTAFAVSVADLDGDGKNDLSGAIFSGTIVSMLRNRNNEPYLFDFFPKTAATGDTVFITGSNFTGTISVKFGGVPTANFIVIDSAHIKAVVGTGASGAVSVGTTYGTDSRDNFIFAGPPSIVSFTPTSAGPGQTVTISGYNFNNTSGVSFGGTPAASFTIVSPNIVTAVLGNGSSGSVAVTTNYGVGSLGGFTFLPFPIISSFTPTSAAAGNSVSITGSNFTGTNLVSFGGTPASSFVVNSATNISAVVGNGTSGTVSVVNNFGTGTLSGFTFIPAPVINSFLPLSGQTGTLITISGANFSNVTAVNFGGVPANSFTIVSSTVITAIVGTGATGSVSIVSPGGTTLIPGFTFIPPPSITSIAPDLGPAGTNLIITGTGFQPSISGNKVTIGSVEAVVSAASTTSLSVVTPSVATNKPVAVQTNHLIASSTIPFRTTFSSPDPVFTSGSFTQVLKTHGGRDPEFILNCDIDGDGKLDIIDADNYLTFNSPPRSIAVLRNTSSPSLVSFAPKLLFERDVLSVIAGVSYNILAVDLDGDGKPDIITDNSILRNTSTPGNISFDPWINMYISGWCLNAADLDGDGRIDITFRRGNDSLLIYRNKSTPGNINFDNPVSFYVGSMGSSTTEMSIDDLDGDQKPDISFTQPNLCCIRNLSTPGNLNFSAPIVISPSLVNDQVHFATGDLDGDGKKDVVASVQGILRVLKNMSIPGTISFTNSPIVTTGYAGLIKLGDLNGDGKPEIIFNSVIGPTSYLFSVYQNVSNLNNLTFLNQVNFETGVGGPTDICLGDLNGDNKMDIALNQSGNDTVRIFLNLMGNSTTQACVNNNILVFSNITGSTYQWQQNSGSGFVNISNNNYFTGTNTSTLQIIAPPITWTNYQYRCIIDGSNISNLTTISILPLPVITASSDTTICSGTSIQLNASGGTAYSWSPVSGLNNAAIANPIASPTSTTSYILTVTNAVGCISKDTVVITVNPTALSPSVSITTADTNICFGSQATFIATPVNGGTNPNYQWQINAVNSGNNNSSFTSSALKNNDLVKVILTSNSACVSNHTATSNIITMTVQPQLTTPLVSLSNKVFTVTNPDNTVSYTWQINSNNTWINVVPLATGITYTAPAAGEYRVMTVKGPCTSYSISQVTSLTGGLTANNPFGINLYPNPGNDVVKVDSIKLSQNWETLEVINTDGKQVLPSLNIKNQTSVLLSVSTLIKGTYFIQLRKKDGEFTTLKFIKI